MGAYDYVTTVHTERRTERIRLALTEMADTRTEFTTLSPSVSHAVILLIVVLYLYSCGQSKSTN